VRNAHRIVAGEKPWRNAAQACDELGVEEGTIDDDFFFVHREDPEDVAELIVDFAARRIPQKYGLDAVRDVMVLAPMKKGPCGLEELNRRMQLRLNPNGDKVGVKDLRLGDRVIQTRNNYNIGTPRQGDGDPSGVMNGEVGVIDQWDREEQRVRIDFLDRQCWISTSDLDSFLPAYAISVHRSQGSQAPAVVCAVATSHWIMLTRSLVNTAITARPEALRVCRAEQGDGASRPHG